MNAERFDAVIIGTGQSGKPLASALGRAGWKVAIVERRYVGGTCINVGCTPTKTMVASARVAYLARRGPEYGVHGDASIRVDMAEVRARKQKIVEQFRSGGERSLAQTPNVDLIFGEASFVDARTVRVALKAGGERFVTAAKIVVQHRWQTGDAADPGSLLDRSARFFEHHGARRPCRRILSCSAAVISGSNSARCSGATARA